MKWTFSESVREHIKSAILTFLSGFTTEILAHINSITAESFKDGAVWGFLFLGVRQGMKLSLEMFLLWKSKR